MRLTEIEKKVICRAIHSLDPEAAIYLFGSRTDDQARGGDIDLLVLSEKLDFADKLQIKKRIFENMEEQKIDIIIASDTASPFVQQAKQKGIPIG